MWHARISMDEISEARFLGKNNVVLDVQYDCCAYIVYVASMMCALVALLIYIACVLVIYPMLCIGWYK